jgi:polyhydroxybutyrate depolymerase
MAHLGRQLVSARCWLAVALLSLAVTACDGTGGPEDEREGEGVLGEWVRSGGYKRTYVLHLPPSYAEGELAPLLLLFHGAGDTGAGFRATVAMDSLADDARFITVYPDGLDGTWYADDLHFVRTLIVHLSEGLSTDLQRVYVAGFSSGAVLCHYLACTMSTELAGVASVGATMKLSIASNCRPVVGVPITFIHGTADPGFPWDGASTGDDVNLSMSQTISTWTSLNQCPNDPIVQTLPDSVPDGTQVQIDLYESCRDGSEVVLYSVYGGGHTWPGSPLEWPEWAGAVSREINAGQAIIEFFQRHPGGE